MAATSLCRIVFHLMIIQATLTGLSAKKSLITQISPSALPMDFSNNLSANALSKPLEAMVSKTHNATALGKIPLETMKSPLYHSPRVFAADYAEMKQKLKIFMYPFPAKESNKFGYTRSKKDVLPKGNYASEDYFFRNVLESELLTENPNEATFFLLPFSVFKLRMTVGPTKVADFVREYMEETLKKKWPYWNRTGGADHLYATCHDIGVSAASSAPGLSHSAVQVICPASRWHRNYVPTKDFSFPQIWPRYGIKPGGFSAAERKASKMLAFWSGSQIKKTRAEVKAAWQDDDEILLGGGKVLKEKRYGNDYFDLFRKAKYCLHIKGHQVHTARVGDAIYFGCVPVILADQYDLPYSQVLDWNEFSVIVLESQIPRLKAILKAIPDERYEQLHANVVAIRHHFSWNSPPQDYDLFNMLMYHLWLRRFVIRPNLGEDIE